MSDTPAVYVLTNSQLRTLLESARAGDSIDDAMLQADEWNMILNIKVTIDDNGVNVKAIPVEDPDGQG